MKTILVLMLVAASMAAMPHATANNTVCQGTLCATEGSYAYGADCANGGAGNYVFVTNNDGSSYSQVDAYSYCGAAPGAYSYQYVGVDYFRAEPSGYHYGGVQWFAFDFFGNATCGTLVYGTETGMNDLGCPAGAPPAVPALLP